VLFQPAAAGRRLADGASAATAQQQDTLTLEGEVRVGGFGGPDALALTWQSLAEVGNLSSASVLHVLADTLDRRTAAAGEYGLLLAMGPGFCSELVLLQW